MKRGLTFILVLILAFSALTSCAEENKSGTENTASQTETATQNDPEIKMIEEYVDSLAENSHFGGMTFSYIANDNGVNIPTEEAITGNLHSDALYMRQVALEEKFGIDFNNIKSEDGGHTQDAVIREVMSGGTSYDLVHGSMTTVGQPLMLNSAIRPVDDLSAVDISCDWWLRSLEERYMISGRLFFLSGSILAEHFFDGTCMVFNKNVAENYGVPDLYEIVESKEWTIDKMTEIASVIPTNQSGDGTFRYCFGGDAGLDLFYSCGFRLIRTDENGSLYVETTLPKDLSDFADKVSSFLGDDTQTCACHMIGGDREDFEDKYGVTGVEVIFEQGRAFLCFSGLRSVSKMREYDVDFGVLPSPKRDMNQKEYMASGNGAGFCVYIPKTVKDLEFTDVITEAMAALSNEYLKPAFIEKMLKGRSTYDIESRGMIDMIFNARVNDLIDIFSGGDMNSSGDFVNLIAKSTGDNSSGFASSYNPLAKLTQKKIDQMEKQLSREK